MSSRSSFLDESVRQYIVDSTVREDVTLRKLREETAGRANATMAISPEQGQLMALLARLIGARRYLEIGVFTGYSSLAVALALPRDGYVLACDVNDDSTAVARRYWTSAGVMAKFDLRIGPALETLASLPRDVEPFDMAFIDADKVRVNEYYERCLELVRPNGLILVDNVLWGGAVMDAEIDDDDTRALRLLNVKAGRDDRVDASLLPIGDGLLIARKRA